MMETIYQELRKQIDQYSVGFPKAESGVDLKILKKTLYRGRSRPFS